MKFGSLFSKIFILACLFLSTNIFAMEDEEKLKQLGLSLSQSGDEGTSKEYHHKELTAAFNSGKIEAFEIALNETLADDPEIINSPEFGSEKTDTLLCLTARQNKLEMIKALINAKADVNRSNGSGGLTPLHLAAGYGHLDTVKYFVENAKADVEAPDTIGRTPLDFAKKAGHRDVIKYLSSKTILSTFQILDLSIFIDHSDEINKPVGGISHELRQTVIEESVPCLIFGKHLLDNVRAWLSQDEWIVSNFLYNNFEVIFLIPKKYAQFLLKKEIKDIKVEELLKELGFSWNKDFNKKSNGETSSGLSFNSFSKLVPEVIDKFLTNSYLKCIFITGHGSSIHSGAGAIVDLNIKDAINLFSILEEKNTKLIYASSCFLGGENLLEVQNQLNRNLNKTFLEGKKPFNMIFISGATTEAPTTIIKGYLNKFFKEFKIYLNKEERLKNLSIQTKQLSKEENKARLDLTKEIGSLRAAREYFAKNITNWLTDYDVCAIPQIRFPARDAKFYSLASAVIDEITLGTARGITFKGMEIKPKFLEFSNQKTLVINMPEVDIPIKIKGQNPLLISGIGLHNFVFNEINIKDTDCDFIDFITYAIVGGLMGQEKLFKNLPYQETFFIKKLVLTKTTSYGKSTIPTTLYDVSIVRGNNIFTATVKDRDPKLGDYKIYKYIYSNNEAKLFDIEEDMLKEELKNAFDSGDIIKLKNALATVKKSKYPDLINSIFPSKTTLLCEAISLYKLATIKALIEAGADANQNDELGISPLTYAIRASNRKNLSFLLHCLTKNFNQFVANFELIPYLIEHGANVNKPDYAGETPLHFAAQYENLDAVKYLVENAHVDINLKNKTGQTPEDLAKMYKHQEIADYLASKKPK